MLRLINPLEDKAQTKLKSSYNDQQEKCQKEQEKWLCKLLIIRNLAFLFPAESICSKNQDIFLN
jgi:hypothetical protein